MGDDNPYEAPSASAESEPTSNPYEAPSAPAEPEPRSNPYQAPPAGQASASPYAGQQAPLSPNQGKIPPIVIIGFVLSLVGGILGGILCFIGLSEAKKQGAGEGLAIAGIVISVVSTLWFLSTMSMM